MQNRRCLRSLALGGDRQAGEAIGLVNVDSPIPPDVINEIRSIPAVRVARVVEIG